MIAEPTLEHYIYYLRRAAGDDNAAIGERRDAFERELGALLAHLEHLSDQPVPAWEWPLENEDRRVSQRIMRTDWLDNPETSRSYFVEARTYGDIYWLQVGYYQKSDQAGPEIFASLRDEMWQPSATDALLGSSSYLCGIVAGDLDGLAAQALKTYSDDASGVISTHLADGCARLHGAPLRPDVLALFYRDPQCEEWAGEVILNDIALRLELYKHKAHRQLAWCEDNFPLLSQQEQTLRDLLEKANRVSPVDPELLRKLVQLYRVFDGNVGMLAERQTTIAVNLDNLGVVVADLGSLTEDHLLATVQSHLRRRQKQLEVDLEFLDQTRQQAGTAINTFKVELALDRLTELQAEPGDALLVDRAAWREAPPPLEAEINVLRSHQKPSQSIAYPQIVVPPQIVLTADEKAILQKIYRGFGQVLIEKEFGGGYGGARVLLVLPLTLNGIAVARKVTKLGPAPELRRERDNYEKYVEDSLPFSTARVERERYYEQNGRAGLNYVFVGGGMLGRAVDLEEYYQEASRHDIERVIRTLDDLLCKELGERWYGQTTPLHCFFAAEYGVHMAEHLRLKLRPDSSDGLWPMKQLPVESTDHRQIEIEAIPRDHETIQPGTLLSIEGMVVRRLKLDEVTLQDPEGQGIVVGVKFAPGSGAAGGLELGSKVKVRGEVVYNRRGRMEQIVRSAFPDLAPSVAGESLELPGVAGPYPNPLKIYPQLLSKVLAGRRSCGHGDLHLRNVLVDEWGKGWLIDFALVGERHNLFDFIKLETYVRLTELARDDLNFVLDEYVQFEEALTTATLGQNDITLPPNPHLEAAYRVILAIRRMARKYMAPESDFQTEYFTALALYCLSVVKYYRDDAPQPTRLIFLTACVLIGYLLGIGTRAHPAASASGLKPGRKPPSSGNQPAARSHHGAGHRWAVMAGVNTYQDRDISRLKCCIADVQAIHRFLTHPARGSFRARLIVDTAPDALPTRNNVLAELANVARAAGEDDLLLFYFSGHGAVEAGEAYLIPCDARLTNLADTAIPVRRVKDIMAGSPAQAKVILLDACHSGARIGKAEARMPPEFIERVFRQAEGLAILASCQQGQVSYEWEEAGQSVFTHYLLEGLASAADFDKKGFVTIQDINRYVADQVKAWAVGHGRLQTPTLGGGWSGDIVIADCAEEQGNGNPTIPQ